MDTVMKASKFVKKLIDIAKNHKTLYIKGCFGAPMSSKNKTRYCNNHSYNQKAARTKMIQAASADTFGFDCVCLLKGVLWGWNGDTSKGYGGAKYTSNGVPDIGANQMIKVCSELSTDFSDIEVGEAVWMPGHIGVYIGNGLSVECTPKWDNCVQITACNCVKPGYNTRAWKKHGKLPYIDYDIKSSTTTETVKPQPSTSGGSAKVDYAQKFDKSIAGSYEVTASVGLHIRSGPNTKKTSLGVLPRGTVVRNYGYYSVAVNGVRWLYVKTPSGLVGFCSSTYLRKR